MFKCLDDGVWVNLVCVGWLNWWNLKSFLFFCWSEDLVVFLYVFEEMFLFFGVFVCVWCGLIFVDISVDVENLFFLDWVEFFLFVLLFDESVKKVVVGDEGIFNVMFVFVCVIILLMEIVEDVLVWIESVCE